MPVFLPSCGASCGDCDSSGGPPTVLDALRSAQIGVGLSYYHPCCDVDADGDTDVLDALLTAQVAAGLPVALTCP